MKTKELEARILQLEKELSELKSQMLSLALNRTSTIYVIPTAPIPYTPPYIAPYMPTYPTYPTYPNGQTVTYGTTAPIEGLQVYQNLM
jgi:hypothetical protein